MTHKDNVLNGQKWIEYSGRWGEIGVSGGELPVIGDTGSSGPFGPAMKGKWYDDDEVYVVGKLLFKSGNNGGSDPIGETTDEPGQVIKSTTLPDCHKP